MQILSKDDYICRINMSKPDHQRKKVFIEKSFQGKSIAIVAAIVATMGILSSLLLYFLLYVELNSELNVASHQINNIWDRLASTVITTNVITVGITCIAAAYAVLYQSHKIAGPLYRLQQVCKEVMKGNLNPVTELRKSDQLIPLAEVFSNMVDALKVDNECRQQALDDALVIVKSLMDCDGDIEKEKLTQELELSLRNMKE